MAEMNSIKKAALDSSLKSQLFLSNARSTGAVESLHIADWNHCMELVMILCDKISPFHPTVGVYVRYKNFLQDYLLLQVNVNFNSVVWKLFICFLQNLLKLEHSCTDFFRSLINLWVNFQRGVGKSVELLDYMDKNFISILTENPEYTILGVKNIEQVNPKILLFFIFYFFLLFFIFFERFLTKFGKMWFSPRRTSSRF